MDRKHRLLIWTGDIDGLLDGSSSVSGLAVQMYFWSKTFISKGWSVYALSSKDNNSREGIHFIKSRTIRYVGLFVNIFEALFNIIRIRPKYIFFRGADRSLCWVTLFAHLCKSKVVFFGASDVNFQPGKDTLVGNPWNTKLYRMGLKEVDYVITQNQSQSDNLLTHYKKSSAIIHNIWMANEHVEQQEKPIDVFWVSYMRTLKRPEWFIRMAQELPQYSFAMAGGPALDKNYYNEIKAQAEVVHNMQFFGPLPFKEVNEKFSKCKLFACTSEYEGFPNTFLQTWSNNAPVVSTVNPSGILTTYSVGVEVDTYEALKESIVQLLENKTLYNNYCESVTRYFYESHSTDSGYRKLIKYLENNEI